MSIYASILLVLLSLSAPKVAYEQIAPKSAQNEIVTLTVATVEATKPPPALPEEFEQIAFCESGGKHFDENGKVVRGSNPDDIGKYQINEKFWGEGAKKLGYDIYTEEGNEAMALELYNRYHTKPWKWSKKCWDSK